MLVSSFHNSTWEPTSWRRFAARWQCATPVALKYWRASLRTRGLRRSAGFGLLRPAARQSLFKEFWNSAQSRRNQSGQLGYLRQVSGRRLQRLQDTFGTLFTATDA